MPELRATLDVAAYLDRIGYTGSTAPTLPTLRALHRAHMLAAPFENLDIARRRRIALDESRLFDKIVVRRRGGFCYELNGLFAELLRTLGYRVEMLAARVATAGIPFGHLALRVLLDEPWLADVGFGDSFTEPLRLVLDVQQPQEGSVYRIVAEGDEWQVQRQQKDGWARQYQFALAAFQWADFAGGCEYHQSSPDSIFTQRRICSRATPGGRVTLSEMKLIISDGGQRSERALASDAEYAAVLRDYFDITLD